MRFEWSPAKNEHNIEKHGIDFEDAIGIFAGTPYRYASDRTTERGVEARTVAVGELDGRIIAVVYTMRGDATRIISARRARTHEQKDYERQRDSERDRARE